MGAWRRSQIENHATRRMNLSVSRVTVKLPNQTRSEMLVGYSRFKGERNFNGLGCVQVTHADSKSIARCVIWK